jgi:hypothetical protein
MKKFLITSFVISLALFVSLLSPVKVSAGLADMTLPEFIQVLLSVGAVPQDKVSLAQNFLTEVSKPGFVSSENFLTNNTVITSTDSSGIHRTIVKKQPVSISTISFATSTTQSSNFPLNIQTDLGKDSQIKANLANLRAEAELYYDDNKSSYSGVCDTKGTYASKLIASSSAVCKSDSDYWLVYAPLSTGQYYCSDNTGMATIIDFVPSEKIISCVGQEIISSIKKGGVSTKPIDPRAYISFVDVSKTTGSGSREIYRVNVAADARGPITLMSIPLILQAFGEATVNGSNFVSVQVNGSNIVASASTIGVSRSTTGATTTSITFNSGYGYDIAAGSVVTFSIYDTISLSEDGDSIVTSISDPSLFTWINTNSSTTQILNGTDMPSFPLDRLVPSTLSY